MLGLGYIVTLCIVGFAGWLWVIFLCLFGPLLESEALSGPLRWWDPFLNWCDDRWGSDGVPARVQVPGLLLASSVLILFVVSRLGRLGLYFGVLVFAAIGIVGDLTLLPVVARPVVRLTRRWLGR